MTLNDYLLAYLTQYGLPVLFGVIVIAAVGVPMPATLLLLTAGAFVDSGDLDLWTVLGLTAAAAVLGDVLGYSAGRWGSDRLIGVLTKWGGGAERIAQAERAARRWGGMGIFLSRWLLSPIGPIVNLTSGVARYPLLAFVGFDVAGEIVWVVLYVTLGRYFSDQVQSLSSAIGNFSYAILGVAAMALIGWQLWRGRRQAPAMAPALVEPGGQRRAMGDE